MSADFKCIEKGGVKLSYKEKAGWYIYLPELKLSLASSVKDEREAWLKATGALLSEYVALKEQHDTLTANLRLLLPTVDCSCHAD